MAPMGCGGRVGVIGLDRVPGRTVLAATGLLHGRRATTHWRYIEQLGQAFPAIVLQPDVLYVDEGDILTSAGSAAGIDLCLHIIRKDFGRLAANKVARRLVVSPHREGGQAQFIDKPVGEQSNPWLAHLLEWVQRKLRNPITIEQLAKQVRMSKRTFYRRFTETTGTSPLDWITTLRVRQAQDLLETTRLSVEEIADKKRRNLPLVPELQAVQVQTEPAPERETVY